LRLNIKMLSAIIKDLLASLAHSLVVLIVAEESVYGYGGFLLPLLQLAHIPCEIRVLF